MHVSPGPELVRRGEARRRARDLDERERPIEYVACLFELVVFEDDERDPWRQPPLVGRRRRRCVAPGKILVVELDEREVVVLEVRDPRPGLRADNRSKIDADDIARTVERDLSADAHDFFAAADARAPN